MATLSLFNYRDKMSKIRFKGCKLNLTFRPVRSIVLEETVAVRSNVQIALLQSAPANSRKNGLSESKIDRRGAKR